MTAEIIEGDCLAALPTLPDASVDAVVTDPPYDLASGKGKGFMGKCWDGTQVAFRPETWAAVLKVLRPGGYLLAFGGTRTYHRMACAIEDAGFEIRDCLMWLYGTGFPKGKGCLKPAWEPIILARRPGPKVLPLGIDACRVPIAGSIDPVRGGYATPGNGHVGSGGVYEGGYAGTYDGAQQPHPDSPRHDVRGRFPPNLVMSHHPDCERIGVKRVKVRSGTGGCDKRGKTHGFKGARFSTRDDIHPGYATPDGTEVVEAWRCVAGCPVKALDQQAGERKSGLLKAGTRRNTGGGYMGDFPEIAALKDYGGDSGNASRFFPTFAPFCSCDLCGLLSGGGFDIISWESETQETNQCPSARSAVENSSRRRNGRGKGSARAVVPGSQPPGNGDSKDADNSRAKAAESGLKNGPGTGGNIVPPDAASSPIEELARHVRSAANLCDSCATAIARNLAAMRHGRGPVLLPGQDSISEPRRQILIRSLVQLAEDRENTDTIPTTASLTKWFGSVRDAIFASIMPESRMTGESDTCDGLDPQPHQLCLRVPYFYCSKASRRERNEGLEGMPKRFLATMNDGIGGREHNPDQPGGWTQNNHPTVKPLALMRWLCRLVTPPGGLVLDPFAGSGSTGVAALREGFRFLGIEQSPEYCAIARARLDKAAADRPLLTPA